MTVQKAQTVLGSKDKILLCATHTLILSLLTLTMKFLTLKNVQPSLLLSDYCGFAFQRPNSLLSIVLQNSLLLILSENCYLTPMLHMIFATNLDSLQVALGSHDIITDNLAQVIFLGAVISCTLVASDHSINRRYAQRINEFNAYLINDRASGGCTLKVRACLQDFSIRDALSLGPRFDLGNRLIFQVLKNDQMLYRELPSQVTLGQIFGGCNTRNNQEIIKFLKRNFSFDPLIKDFDQIMKKADPQSYQRDRQNQFLSFQDGKNSYELEFDSELNILTLIVVELTHQPQIESLDSEQRRKLSSMAIIGHSLSELASNAPLSIQDSIKSDDALARGSISDEAIDSLQAAVRQCDSLTSNLSFAALVDGHKSQGLHLDNNSGLKTPQNRFSKSSDLLSSSDAVLKRNTRGQVDFEIEEVLENSKQFPDISLSESSEIKSNQSSINQENNGEFFLPQQKISQSHKVKASSINNEGDDQLSQDSRNRRKSYDSIRLNLRDTENKGPIQLQNMKDIIAGEIRSQSIEIALGQKSQRDGKKFKHYSSMSSSSLSKLSPFEKMKMNFHMEKIAKLNYQLKNNKTFFNMAVHDMRNPTNAITFGVNETLQMLKNQKKKIESIRKMRKDRKKFISSKFCGIKRTLQSSDSCKFVLRGTKSDKSDDNLAENNSSYVRQLVSRLGRNQSVDVDVNAFNQQQLNKSQVVSIGSDRLRKSNNSFKNMSHQFNLNKQVSKNSESSQSNSDMIKQMFSPSGYEEEKVYSGSRSSKSPYNNKRVLQNQLNESSNQSDLRSFSQQSPAYIDEQQSDPQIVQREISPSSSSLSLSFHAPRRMGNSDLHVRRVGVVNVFGSFQNPDSQQDIREIERQCDFEGIDEDAAELQPRISKFNNNETSLVNNKDFYRQIRQQLEIQVQKYSGDARQLQEIQSTLTKCHDLCQQFQIKERVILKGPEVKNTISRETQCDGPAGPQLGPQVQANQPAKLNAQRRPRRALSQNSRFECSNLKFDKRIQCNLQMENSNQSVVRQKINSQVLDLEKKVKSQASQITMLEAAVKSLKQQLGKQSSVIEYQNDHLQEIEQQCVLEKSFLEKIEKFLQNAAFSATMLGNLINDMLDLAKFESGTFKFHIEFFDLIEVIEQAFETIRYQAERKDISISYKILDNRGVPDKKYSANDQVCQSSVRSQDLKDCMSFEADKELVSSIKSGSQVGEKASDEVKQMFYQLLGDKNRYTQMVLNFLSNSIHYTKKGGKICINLVLLEDQAIKQMDQTKTVASMDIDRGDMFQNQSLNEKDLSQSNQRLESASRQRESAERKNQSAMNEGLNIRAKSEKSVESQQLVKLEQNQSSKFVKFRIEIADTGVGIKKENLGKLFCDFSRLDDGMNNTGTGLGLSICKKMIEKMGGKVGVESEWGVGTTFKITLRTKSIPIIKYKSCEAGSDMSVSNNQSSENEDSMMDLTENESFVNSAQFEIKEEKKMFWLRTESKDKIKPHEDLNQNSESSYYMSSQQLSHEQMISKSSQYPQIQHQVSDLNRDSDHSMSSSNHQISSGVIIKKQSIQPAMKQSNQMLSDIHEDRQENSIASLASDRAKEEATRRDNIFLDQKMSHRSSISSLNSDLSQEERDQRKSLFSFGVRSKGRRFNHQNSQALDNDIEENEIVVSGRFPPNGDMEESKQPISKSQSSNSPRFIFPSSKAPKQQSNQAQKRSSPARFQRKDKFKCLVANDCDFQLMQIELILQNCGIDVTKAINGLDALELITISKCKFDFIILDLSMPIMDGFDACKQIMDYYQDEYQLLGSKQSVNRLQEFVEKHKDENEMMAKSQELLEVFQEIGKQPILVALSALINEDVKKKCLKAGFTEILEAPLSKQKVEEILKLVALDQQVQIDLENLLHQQKQLFMADMSSSSENLSTPSENMEILSPKFKSLRDIKSHKNQLRL